jgi:peptidoglycan/LPS O-acetylase OafA/YrhL
MDEANAFLSGASVVTSAGIALFFLRFWQRSGDRLFGIFALAFAVFAANRGVLVIMGDDDESAAYVYLVRLAAFLLILLAIIDRNRRNAPEPES